jgi:hypothetical protein
MTMTNEAESPTTDDAELLRRSGERRSEALPLDEASERRRDDRRVSKPGFGGLIKTLLGKR